jgi:hypothetical protein
LGELKPVPLFSSPPASRQHFCDAPKFTLVLIPTIKKWQFVAGNLFKKCYSSQQIRRKVSVRSVIEVDSLMTQLDRRSAGINAQFPNWFRGAVENFTIAGFGLALVWFGPTLSGWGALHASWCLSAGQGVSALLTQSVWQATQHCPYCYVGVALMGIALARAATPALFSTSKASRP